MQRLDPREAQDVIRLAGERTTAPSADGTTVENLADSLGLPTDEVERLLTEVRQGRASMAGAPVMVARRSFGDRSAALSAAIVLALVIVVATVGGVGYWLLGRHGTANTSSIQGSSAAPNPPPTPKESTLIQTDPEGNMVIKGPKGETTTIRGKGGNMTIETTKP